MTEEIREQTTDGGTAVAEFPAPNEHGVFESRDCETIPGPGLDAMVQVIEQADGWRFGYSVTLPDSGHGLVPAIDQAPLPAREDAVIAGCEALILWLSDQKEKGSKRHQKLAAKLQDWALDLAKITVLTDRRSAAVAENEWQPTARMAFGAGEIRRIPTSELYESPLNPRQYYPEAAMNELVESMRQSGYREWLPLMVRPRAESGYEIGAGHRRCRAAQSAGIEEIPCVVRDMTDEEFLDVLNFDNTGREDVHPLHEAAGWRAWMKATGKGVLDIAARIGQSKEYVYQRLKYADLIPEAQKAFLDGELTGAHWVAIARLQPEAQAKALEHCQPPAYQPDYRVSYRELERWIHGNFCLSLAAIPFDRSDAALLDSAGSCDGCHKRGVNIPGYTSESGDLDVCTDLKCYEAKKRIHLVRAKNELIARSGYDFVEISVGYQRAGKGVYLAGAYKEVPEAQAARHGVKLALFVDGPRLGQTTYVQLPEVAASSPEPAQPTKSSSPAAPDWDEQERRLQKAEEESREYHVRLALVGAVGAKATEFDREAIEYFVEAEIGGLGCQEYEWLCERHGAGKKSLITLMETMPDKEFARLLVELSLMDQTDMVRTSPNRLNDAVKRFGVDVQRIRAIAEAAWAINNSGIDFDAVHMACMNAGGKEELAYVNFRRVVGGYGVNAGVSLPMAKGHPFGEYGPVGSNDEVWTDKGKAIDAAFAWLKQYLGRAMKHSGVTAATEAAAVLLRRWIRKGQAARAGMVFLSGAPSEAPAKKNSAAAKKQKPAATKAAPKKTAPVPKKAVAKKGGKK